MELFSNKFENPFPGQFPEYVQYEILQYICNDLSESDVLSLRLINKKYAYGIFNELILKYVHLKLKDEVPSCIAPKYWCDNFNKVGELTIEICKRIKFLNIYYPVDYLTIESFDYVELRKLYVSKKVKKLRIYHTSISDYYDTHTDDIEIYGGNIINVDSLKYKKNLLLNTCNNVIDVSPLANIRKLELIRMENISDVSSLKDIHELSLTELGKVEDVSMLRNHKLELIDMWNVYDVSSLGAVHDLTIDRLPITSVDGLENVKRLELRHLTNIDTSKLKNNVLITKDMKTHSLFHNGRHFDNYNFYINPDSHQPSGHINISPPISYYFTYRNAQDNAIGTYNNQVIITSETVNFLVMNKR